MEIALRPHQGNLVRFAQDRPELLVLSADLTSSCEAQDFRAAYPDRFFSMGMAEQNMMGVAGGLAREGFVPYIHTFAVFITRRPFDQVAMSIGYPNLKVRLLGFLPGITTPGGVTHQAIDDVALMRSIPNMTVLELADATDVLSMMDAIHDVNGPVYVRMLRGEVPVLFPKDDPIRIGKIRRLSDGNDLLVLSSGVCTEEALRAAAALRNAGLSIRHLHLTTLKPFDAAAVVEAASDMRLGAITLENHSIIGGLGSATAEAFADAGLGKRLVRLGIKDCYAHGASKKYLMKNFGIDARALVTAAESLAGASFNIPDETLAEEVRVAAAQAKAEEL